MPTKVSTHTKQVVRDPYTERVLAVCYELVKRKALKSKTDFSRALGFKHLSQYNAIEKREANFPPNKSVIAEAQLLDKWGVNPSFIKGHKDAKMFLREPEQVKMAVGEGAVLMNFRDKREKEELLAELEAKTKRIAELEAQVAKLTKASLGPIPDRKSDKKK